MYLHGYFVTQLRRQNRTNQKMKAQRSNLKTHTSKNHQNPQTSQPTNQPTNKKRHKKTKKPNQPKKRRQTEKPKKNESPQNLKTQTSFYYFFFPF